jgi:chaperone LolA
MKKTTLLFIMLCMLGSLEAQNVNDIIKKVQNKYDGLKFMSAVFSRTETFKITGAQSETIGKIYMAKGDKYRFESEEQVIVTDGKSIWAYSQASNQVIIEKIKENSPALLPRDLLFNYPKKYYSTLLSTNKEGNKTIYLLKLDPKEDTQGYIKGIRLWIEKDSWMILKVEITDMRGNTTLFELKEVDTSNKIPDSFFTYVPGEGVEIHDRR